MPTRQPAQPLPLDQALGALARAARSRAAPAPQPPKQRTAAPKPPVATAATGAARKPATPPSPASAKPKPPAQEPPEPPAPPGGSGNPVTQAARRAVWVAEDGRCEACRRPMNQRLGRACRVDPHVDDWSPQNLHLLCPYCADGRPDPLASPLAVAPSVTDAVSATTCITEPTWLVEQLRRHAVLIEADPLRVWLPGVGVFALTPAADAKAGAAVLSVVRLYPAPAELRIQPQRCTRGLPRPAPPGP